MRRWGVLCVVALALAACQAAVKPDPAALAQNKALFEQVRTGQSDAVLAQLPVGNRPAMAATLDQMKAIVPSAPPQSIKPVAASEASTPGGRAEVLAVEYDFADRTIRFTTRLVEPKGTQGWRLLSFSVLEASHKELSVNGLSPELRPPAQLAFLALAIASPILMLAALVKVLRTPGLQNRWLWAAFAFVGLFSFQMNWASGAMLIQWMALQIIGFWMAKGPSAFDPLFINATVPIGALLILAGLAARKPKA